MAAPLKSTIEYLAARTLLEVFGKMPRRLAYSAAECLASLGFRVIRRQRRVGLQNLRMAFPEKTDEARLAILRASFGNLGRLLVEFSCFPALNRENISSVVVYDGFEHYEAAVRRGKGVLFLTAHVGAWELSSFAHSIHGHPMKFLVRPIDNSRVEKLIAGYRCLGGNEPIERRNSARRILQALRENETVGILVDQNASDGIFVDFFGIPAATTTVLATLALRTGATVIPGFLIWDPQKRIHRLRFEAPVDLIDTGEPASRILKNTQLFNNIVERVVREHPEQWLWIHRRWKTRPPGSHSFYD